MINPYKNAEGIQNFYVSQEGNHPLSYNDVRTNKYCQPDMDWIYRKCMMKSAEYREWMETRYTRRIPLHPLVAKIPELKEYYLPKLKNNNPGQVYGIDYTVETPVFNHCALAYQDFCQKFQDRIDIEQKFNLK